VEGLLFLQQAGRLDLVVMAEMELHQFQLLAVMADRLPLILVLEQVEAEEGAIMELAVLVVLMADQVALAVLDGCKYFGCNKYIILYIQFLKVLI
jgi:hypothetical protein